MAEAQDLSLSERLVQFLQGPNYNSDDMFVMQRKFNCMELQAQRIVLIEVVSHIPLSDILDAACNPSTFHRQASYLRFLTVLVDGVQDFSRSVANIPDIWKSLFDILEQDAYPQPCTATQDGQEIISTRQTEIQILVNIVCYNLLKSLKSKHIEAFIESCILQKIIKLSESNIPRWKKRLGELVTHFWLLGRLDQSVFKTIDDLNLKERADLLDEGTLMIVYDSGRGEDKFASQALMKTIYGYYKKKNERLQKHIAICSNCGKCSKKQKICDRCRSAFYCDRKCQKEHWKKHKKVCKLLKAKRES